MSFEGLMILLPVLFFALVGVAVFRAMRRRSGGWPQVTGTITASRIGENDAGSATDYYPILSVTYAANGQSWQADNIAAARETHRDVAKVKALIEGAMRPGASVVLAHDPASPSRVMIV